MSQSPEMPDYLKQLLGIQEDPAKRAMEIRDIDNRLMAFTESLTDEQLTVILNVAGKAGLVSNDEYLSGMGQFCGMLMSERYRRNRTADLAKLTAQTDGLPGGESVA